MIQFSVLGSQLSDTSSPVFSKLVLTGELMTDKLVRENTKLRTG